MRLDDWQVRLADAFRTRAHMPFCWGRQDCIMFGASCVEAVTGRDPAAGIRATYFTEREAIRILRDRGGIETLAAQHLGPEIPPALAQPGDIGIVRNAGRACLAVFGGDAWHVPGKEGLVSCDAQAVERAWRVDTENTD